MQTVYLLLRNNRQTGPFTIDELLQQQLTAGDLIWIEGKSHSWTPVSDMKLTPIEEEAVAAAPAMVVPIGTPLQEDKPARPPQTLEERAEELRRRALSYVPDYRFNRDLNREETATPSPF